MIFRKLPEKEVPVLVVSCFMCNMMMLVYMFTVHIC